MTAVRYRSVHANLQNPDSVADKRKSLEIAWPQADVLKLNDAGADSTGRIIRGLPGAKCFRPGGVGDDTTIAWRDSIFKFIDGDSKLTFQGRGSDGPFGIRGSRGITWVVLEHRATKNRVLEVEMYTVAGYRTYPDIWNKLLASATDEIRRAMAKHPGIPVIISGDMNKRDEVDFPGLNEREVTQTPVTQVNGRLDRFFLIGEVEYSSHAIYQTKSDHKALRVTVTLTGKTAPTTPTPPAGVDPTPTPAPSTPPPVLPSQPARPLAITDRRPRWRYFARRITGDGTATMLHNELPLADVEIEDVLTGHNSLTGRISPRIATLIAADGLPLLQEWGTEIWAEESGNIRGGGLLVGGGYSGPQNDLECVGYTGYATDTPYAAEKFFVETDVYDIFRHIWTHIQTQTGGNLAMTIDQHKLGLKIGVELEQVEFDTSSGPVSFESGPYKLAWYQDHNLDDNLGTLAADYKFDWHEEHWWEGDDLKHHLRLAQRIGARRSDLRFVIGENVHAIPDIERDGEMYADEVWYLGAGEGSAMKRGTARRNVGRLRRVAVEVDPSIRTVDGCTAAAKRELARRYNIEKISDLEVRNHPHAPVGAVQTGDEIFVAGNTGWRELGGWHRVISRKIRPQDAGSRMTLSVVASDQVA